ncbi:MAG: BlaI/MecI/CopY family transcriptional regulator, partial [Acidobacteriota bacterium]|nr:BlaI/MecI/CopY family transcriptional regulator [Acidobacteriota bacterium]
RYSPLLREPVAVSVAIKRLTDRFFSGSVEALATRLVEKELSPEQLKRIQALINSHRDKEPPK